MAVAAHLAVASLFFIELNRTANPIPDDMTIQLVAPPAPPHIVTPPPKSVENKEPAKPHIQAQRVVAKPPAKIALPSPIGLPVASEPPKPQDPPPQPTQAAAPPSFVAALYAHLNANKRYPRAAQQAHVEGTAYLRFTMDHQGRVLSFRLDKSSGHSELDAEVLSLIQRAQPLPLPPPEMAEPVELVIPVQFGVK